MIEIVDRALPYLRNGDVWAVLVILFFVCIFLFPSRNQCREPASGSRKPKYKRGSPQYIEAVKKAREFLCYVMIARRSFLDNSQILKLEKRYDDAFEILYNCSSPPKEDDVRSAMTIYANRREKVDEWNKDFIAHESARCGALFGRLDANQREACVSDEVATLVVAGAGSGKTTTIQKKVEYLIQEKGVAPEDILLLSFTNKAADEMTERLAASMPSAFMSASTFHKFGLDIVKKHIGDSYDVSAPNFCADLVLRALSPDSMTDDECRGALRFFASCANAEPKDKNKFASLGDYIDATKGANFRTIRSIVDDGKNSKTTFAGECVKSFEELEIANWLYLNGIRYEYERKYDKPVPFDGSSVRRTYKPDFYLTDYDIWIEHFGVDEKGHPPAFFSKAEQDDYISGMKWKRRVHAGNGTILIETYSWWHSKGYLIEKLWESLKAQGVTRHGINPRPVWTRLVESKKMMSLRDFARLVSSFISLAKSRRIGPDDLDGLLRAVGASGQSRQRAIRFFDVVRPIYRRYIESLNADNAIDFHDMINKAADYVRAEPTSIHAYKYVIIDEFQDISASRADLIHAVVEASGAKLFCVGDDWQSIYRFAGSDISLFTEFSKYFGFARIVKLENTYRNSQELLTIAGDFIMKNPRQIRKNLKSSMHYARPVVCIPYGSKPGVEVALRSVLEQIAGEVNGEPTSVMLLGRHNLDIELLDEVDGIYKVGKTEKYAWKDHPELSLSFLTVHKAKGLEADYVVILNFRDDLLGFPNMIADDPLLELLLAEHEQIPFAEERRVFYVAITRARRSAFILVPETGASVFMDDLSNEVKPIVCVAGQEPVSCPKCKKGSLVIRKRNSDFYGCTNFPRCDYTLPIQKVPITAQTPRCQCGGFLVPCTNPRNGKEFLGCTEYARLRSIRHMRLSLNNIKH